jgi:L-Lysine epsilon oxidase N-terminal/L-lysine epsilon oxidase C-terminal domain
MPLTYRIHPAIGIARVGDSPDDYFIGPEAPGVPPSLNKPDVPPLPNSTYKDRQGRIKRQGARFRIYEYTEDAAGVVTKVREITTVEAQIEWEVHLANRKAAAPKFEGTGRRNDGKSESDLIIDSGPQRISGANQPMLKLRGTFMQTIDVTLGDLLTDAAGRLIVLGGHGKSQSPLQNELKHFADNDSWCDDVSDGPVRATIEFRGSDIPIVADPAWVIVAPPDFAPPIENVVTLYDVVYNVMARFDPRLAVSDATSVSFTKDIYPILRRVSNLHWVSMIAARRHGEGKRLHFISRVGELSSNKPQEVEARDEIFQALRRPQGGGGNMPKLPDLAVQEAPGAALTETQYRRMERWAKGTFDADWPGAEPSPTPLDKLQDQDRPQALDHAALEACVGGPFFPGIEVGRVMLDETAYDRQRPFRVNANLPPGTLTARMAVPWQADFNDCSIEQGADWWPGQRPNEVRRGQERDAKWVPPDWKHIDMVNKWSQLGFVVAKTVEGNVEYVEDERLV